MRRRIPGYCSTAALSLVALTGASGSALAQALDAETSRLFTPEAAACLEDASSSACGDLLPVMAGCAEDPAMVACAILLADPEAVQMNPEALEQVKQALTGLNEGALPEAPALEAEPEAPPAEPDPAAPEAEAAPQETTEPAAETEPQPPAAEAEPAPEVEAEPAPEAEAEPAPDTAPAPEAEEAVEPEPDAAPAPAEAEAAEEDAAEGTAPSAPAAQGESPEAEVEGGAETAPADVDTGAPAETAEEGAILPEPPEEAAEAPAGTPLPEADAEAEAAEVERLLKEAETAASAEPEVIEEEIVEAAPAPAEAPAPALDAQSQALVDDLTRQPEVADALAVLGAALAQEAEPAPEAAEPAEGAEAADADEAEAPAEVVEELITPDAIRRSTEDFASSLVTKPTAAASDGPNRDLERAGLVALGALAVGMLVNDNRVVARGDDRVIVQRDDGALQVWRDDDAILRRDGGTRRIERYADGTSVSQWERADGSQVVTVRDATGRVISRQRVLVDGTTIPLFNDAARVEPVDVSVLPEMRYRELRLGSGTDPDRALALLEQSEAAALAVDRRFSLRQIRDIRQVRELLPVLSPEPIIFQSNRASIDPNEIANLLQVGRVIERLLDRNPGEVFLIEGHTDATGSAAYNLGLSDRRAESVALALTEFFRIPPENLIVQGYGESYLRIPTEAAEERNRRVVMRRITPLLAQ